MAYQTRAEFQFTGMAAEACRSTDAGSEEAAVVPCADIAEGTHLGAVDVPLGVTGSASTVVMGND
jgi:hypothetical protein